MICPKCMGRSDLNGRKRRELRSTCRRCGQTGQIEEGSSRVRLKRKARRTGSEAVAATHFAGPSAVHG